jgi:two-component system, cell cycle response regulator
MTDSPATILVVDDQEDNRVILKAMLKSQGYSVQEADGGQSAMVSIAQHLPDLVLLDLFMPDLDGFKVCQALQSDPKTVDLPIVFISAVDEPEQKVKAFSLGASDYISKPFHMEEVLLRIARQLTIHLQRRQLTEQAQRLQKQEAVLRQQTQRERLMFSILQRIRQSLQMDDVLNNSVSEVRQLLNTDRVVICRFCPDGSDEIVVESVSSEAYSLEVQLAEHLQTERERQDQLSEQLGQPVERGMSYLDLLTRLQVHANLVIPLFQQESLWGLLIAHHCRDLREWEEWEITLLQQLSTHLAIAIQQAELYQQVQSANQELVRLAYLDGLTQVANRRYFDKCLEKEWLRLRREQTPLSLILCDIDYFKPYNDHFGHPAGDACLQQVAQIIAANVRRPADLVARYGGEEFAILLPNTDAHGAMFIGERIRKAIVSAQLPHVPGVRPRVTASFGVASVVPPQTGGPDGLIVAADQALYQAKHEGRNTCCQTHWQEPYQSETELVEQFSPVDLPEVVLPLQSCSS